MPSASDLSRREFLGVVASALAVEACTRAPYRAADFAVPAKSPVCVFAAADYSVDFGDIIGRGLRELAVDLRDRRVLLKPNMVEFERGSAINTHPAVVAGAAEACLRAGAKDVIIAEGPGHRRDTEYLLWGSGLRDVLADLRIRFVDLNLSDVRAVTPRSQFMKTREIWLPTDVLAADVVVSMPKLKTHHWVGMTGSMKNLFGIVPGAVYGWPKNFLHEHGIENSILDLNTTVRTKLTIVDGVVGMEGDGPIMGQPKAVGVVALGTDPVAVDSTCARLMSLDPRQVNYLEVASRFLGNLDESRIEQRGEPVNRYRTKFDLPARLSKLQAHA